MEEYILISTLNDFIFCPYSIYLHNVYMESSEEIYHASPQVKGKSSHNVIDNKRNSNNNIIMSLPVYSNELCIMGKIDIYKVDQRALIERKYNLKKIYIGQKYQLWAQYFCMIEMGYIVEKIYFYEISTSKNTEIPLPTDMDKSELHNFIEKYKLFHPETYTVSNINKCLHCIYSPLCDKTYVENVY